jgi:hypothetical protein
LQLLQHFEQQIEVGLDHLLGKCVVLPSATWQLLEEDLGWQGYRPDHFVRDKRKIEDQCEENWGWMRMNDEEWGWMRKNEEERGNKKILLTLKGNQIAIYLLIAYVRR